MKRIVLFGAGRSSSHLIDYLHSQAIQNDWELVIADSNLEAATEKAHRRIRCKPLHLEIEQIEDRRRLISSAGMVISMLPAMLHSLVAEDCVDLGVDLATASYLSEEMKSLDESARSKGVVLMNELGLDPGLDHMSAMRLFNKIRQEGGIINSFKSFCGGLVAPASDDNPWNYKISWNPRNVVLAGTGTAIFKCEGEIKLLPYNRLFKEIERVDIPGYGELAMYYNRDSVKYIDLYNLGGIDTMIRGTFRSVRYCKAWSILVDLGMLDPSSHIEGSSSMTYQQFTNAYLRFGIQTDNRGRIENTLGYLLDEESYLMLEWLGLFSSEAIGLDNASPAQIVERLIVDKWLLKPSDRDMIIMQHEIKYIIEDVEHTCISTLRRDGRDSTYTAMSELVGLPLAIYVKLRLLLGIGQPGAHIPLEEGIDEPILTELESLGIVFDEIWS